jgi:hypothetical protein
MQPTARMRTKPLLVPKPGIDGCGSTRWRWQRLAAWARQLWKVALWPTGESPSVARPRQCRAVGAKHDQAADRSGANQIGGSSQTRHQWMPLGPMRAAQPDKAAAARWPPTAAEQPNDLSEPSVGSSKPGINRRWSARWTWPRRATWAVSLRPIALWHASKSTSVAKPM